MLVSRFLVERLENAGVKHVFGLPGDYVLDFYKELWDNKNIDVINNTDENHSGFAADAYARVKGVGCVVVTYNVGASKVINAVQCAYAERSPLIVISGAPGMDERGEGILLHHMVGSFNSQKKMFDNITCASVVLDNPVTAGFQIDQALEALQHYKRPIYIELPRDVAKKAISYDVYKQGTPSPPKSDSENLQEAIKEVQLWISEAQNPVILAGVELARYELGNELIRFARKINIPIATTLLSKSVINEDDPLFAGIYAGGSSEPATRELVEGSDCLLMFGVMLTDLTLCFKPSRFRKRQTVGVSVDGLKVRNHTYTDVQFRDFCIELFKAEIPPRNLDLSTLPPRKEIVAFNPNPEAKITSGRLFHKINTILDASKAVVSDVGDSMFGAMDLIIHHHNHFLCPAFYTSMGSAIPGALGVQVAKPNVRPIVIVGDGGFQMSCPELSTILERHLNPIIFVLNNGGYTTERFLLDGDFNNLRNWDYHRIGELMGGIQGAFVKTEKDLEECVKVALDSDKPFVINVCVDRADVSPCLKRMTQSLGKRV